MSRASRGACTGFRGCTECPVPTRRTEWIWFASRHLSGCLVTSRSPDASPSSGSSSPTPVVRPLRCRDCGAPCGDHLEHRSRLRGAGDASWCRANRRTGLNEPASRQGIRATLHSHPGPVPDHDDQAHVSQDRTGSRFRGNFLSSSRSRSLLAPIGFADQRHLVAELPTGRIGSVRRSVSEGPNAAFPVP